MKLDSNEPTLEGIDDYDGNESKEKRRAVWLIIIAGVVIALVYGFFVGSNTTDNIADRNKTGIFNY